MVCKYRVDMYDNLVLYRRWRALAVGILGGSGYVRETRFGGVSRARCKLEFLGCWVSQVHEESLGFGLWVEVKGRVGGGGPLGCGAGVRYGMMV